MVQLCEAQVFVGFANETLIIQTNLVNISNSNIQNYTNNEYVAMQFYFKENQLSKKLRQYYENQFSYYDIWIVENKRDNYKIYKITPFLNQKIEIIYEFTNYQLLCLDIYVFQDKFILDCTNFIVFQIFFLEFDLNNNQTNQLNLTFKYDLKLQRKLYFCNDLLIILILKNDDNLISIFNYTIFEEIYSLNKTHFKLPSLNIKKIIIYDNYALALTECKRLYQFYFQNDEQPSQICENLQIYEINEIHGVEVLIFTNYHRYKLVNHYCEEIIYTKQPNLFQMVESEGTFLEINKFNFLGEKLTLLQNCYPYNSGKFYYYLQMLLCSQTHYTQQVVLATSKFQQILISNNFYKSGDDLVIIRSMEPGEITYIDQGLEFFPIIDVQSEMVEIQHNELFFGPNITYTFQAEDVEAEINKLILINTYNQQCLYQELIQFRDILFQLFCQFENKSVIIVQNQPQTNEQIFELNQDFQFIYELDIYLDKNYQILLANSQQLKVININTKQITVYNQLNENISKFISFRIIKNYNCQLLSQTIYCINELKQENSFTFELSNFIRLGIDEKVRFIYLSSNNQFLFLITQNNIIIINIFMVDEQVQQFQLVLIIEEKYEVKQLYFSYNFLYIIYSNQGYLLIQKYFQISPQYFKYLGEVDCLGYKIGNLEEGKNGALDYYFVNSEENVIIFQLSKSLQNSFLKVIPNAKFLISSQNQYCLKQENIVNCYTIIQNFSVLKINLDKIKISQSIPYKICAKNSITTKCIKQQLKLLISLQKLIIDGYYIRSISPNEYQIDFQIQQGQIRDFVIIDGNAILLKNIKDVQIFNISISSFQETKDSIILNCYDSIMAFGKRDQNLSKIGNFPCLRFIWIKNHLICYEQLIFRFYDCDSNQNCTFKNQAKIDGSVINIRFSGNFVLLKTNLQLMILQYRPKAFDFRIVFVEGDYSQFELIQSINDNDFWFIRAKVRSLKVYKFSNLQLQIQKTINYYERFYIDNQYQDKNDLINQILTLRYDQNTITLLFLMQLSSHKAYQISLFNNEISISCQFILLWNKSDLLYQTLMFSLNSDLLFLLMNQNIVGVYNVSHNQNFYRSMIFNFKLSQVQQDLTVKKIYHYSYNNEIYMFIQTIKQLYIFQVELNYKIRVLTNKHTLINLNRMKENILIKIEIPNQSDSNNYYYLYVLTNKKWVNEFILQQVFLKFVVIMNNHMKNSTCNSQLPDNQQDQVYCEVIVFTGFPNETLILWPQKVNLSNSNIQNFVDNEYVAMNYYVKENLLQSKVREYYENQFSFYDIWLLHSKRDNYKIFKITPFLNYKTELIYEFTNKRTLCLRIYLFQNKFILDCQNYIDFEINLIEVDLITNNSQTFNITFNHDLGKQRQLYFSNDLIIFLIQELDNDIISVYNQTMQEMYQLNKTNFQLPMLNIKKIIMSNSHIIALTKCQRLYKIYLFQEQPQQLCYNLQIYDIEEIQGVEIMILTKHRLYTLWNYNDCYEKHSNQ
ncbi:hypothetical protein pb186bvf_020990, partial [Paramecium bursaria]